MQVTGAPQIASSVSSRISDVERAIREDAARPLEYAEEFQEGATVAVLDVFSSDSSAQPWHGDYVDSILTSQGLGDPDVLKISHGMSDEICDALGALLKDDGPESPAERLDAYIELSGSQKLIQTNGTLEKILHDPTSSLRVLNQSQGNSRVDIYELLESAAKPKSGENAPVSATGERLAKVVGLDPKAPDFELQELRQRLADRVAQVVDGSSLIAAERERHAELLSSLRDKGVLMVTSAGNNADELDRVRGMGLQVSENFDDDLTSVGPKLIVGALDNQEVAFFSSRYSNVNLLAPGVDVETPLGKRTGTSYAAPQVARQAELIRRQNPDWTVDQVEAETKKSFTATDGFNILS